MKTLTLILASLILVSCAKKTMFDLIPPQPINMHGITLTPTTSWSQLNFHQHNKSTVWTKDGIRLNELMIIGNIIHGDTILKSDNKELPLPVFRYDMLANELEDLVKTSIKNIHGGNITIVTEHMTPQRVGENMGFRLKLSFFLANGLAKTIDSIISIKNRRLYIVMYMAPTLHYFQLYQTELDALFASIEIHQD